MIRKSARKRKQVFQLYTIRRTARWVIAVQIMETVMNATVIVHSEIMATDHREDLATDRRDRKMVIEMAVMKEKTTIIKKVFCLIVVAVFVFVVITFYQRFV